MSRDKDHALLEWLVRMKVVASEGTSRSFTVWRKCVLSQLIMGFDPLITAAPR